VRDDLPVDVVTKEDLVRVNLNVPTSMRNHWKSEAAKQGRSLGDLIIEAVNAHLSK
jgi:hypothetical protein